MCALAHEQDSEAGCSHIAGCVCACMGGCRCVLTEGLGQPTLSWFLSPDGCGGPAGGWGASTEPRYNLAHGLV